MPKESIVAKWTSTKLYLGSRYNIELQVKQTNKKVFLLDKIKAINYKHFRGVKKVLEVQKFHEARKNGVEEL